MLEGAPIQLIWCDRVRKLSDNVKPLVMSAIGLVLLGTGVSGHAAPLTPVTYDLTTGFTETGSGAGNHFEYDTPVFAVDNLEVWAYSDLGIGNADLVAAQIVDYSGVNGLGVCNSAEDQVRGNGNVNSCTNRNQNFQATDNQGEQDWLLFIIPNTPDNEWVSITLESQGMQDMDISYWVGTLSGAPGSFTYADLGPATNIDTTGDNSLPLTIDLGNAQGNALLIGASLTNLDGEPDRLFASSLTTMVPVPPAVWLFGSALAALAARRKIRK